MQNNLINSKLQSKSVENLNKHKKKQAKLIERDTSTNINTSRPILAESNSKCNLNYTTNAGGLKCKSSLGFKNSSTKKKKKKGKIAQINMQAVEKTKKRIINMLSNKMQKKLNFPSYI